MIPKVNKDFLVKDTEHENVELVTNEDHVAKGAENKLMGKGCREKRANSRLKGYVT